MTSKLFIASLIYLFSTMAIAKWTPTNPINPQEILNSATDDRASGDYETALQKHIWFHNNVLKYERSYYGVRLSFALSYWVELANEYSPALDALRNEMMLAKKKVIEGIDCETNPFHDFTSISRELGEFEAVVQLFKYLDSERPEIARNNFNLAKSSLIKSKEYLLFKKYLNPSDDISAIKKQYFDDLSLSKDMKFGSKMKEYAESRYIDSVTTIVSILSVTGDEKEARKIYAEALEKIEISGLKDKLDSALAGEVPEPWL